MITGKKCTLFFRFIVVVLFLTQLLIQNVSGKDDNPLADKSPFWFEEIYFHEDNSFGVVEDIQQDHYGFIWIGTQEGLFRYDGIHFKSYYYSRTDTCSLSNNIVQDLFVDKNGRLWIATANGLNLYIDESDQFTRFVFNDKEKDWNASNFQKIADDLEGNLWIATLGGGVFTRDLVTGQFSRFSGNGELQHQMPSNNIRTVFIDRAGFVWFGSSDNGVFYYHPNDKEIGKLPLGKPDGQHLAGKDIRSIIEGPDGKIWIGTNGEGISCYNKKLNNFTYLRSIPEDQETLGNNVVWYQFVDSKNNIWVCTEGGGLNLFDSGNNTFTRFMFSYDQAGHISSNIVRTINEDSAGNLWIGNFNAPINYLNTSRKPFIFLQNELKRDSKAGSDQITAILVDSESDVWVGTDGGGIWRYNNKSEIVAVYTQDPHNPSTIQNNKPLCFAEDPTGNIWIGHYLGGLSYYNKKEGRFIHYFPDGTNKKPKGKQVWDLILEDDSLWMATEEGLEVFSISEKKFSIFPVNKPGLGTNTKLLWKLYRDSKNRLLIGTSNGLNVLNKSTGKFHYFESDRKNEKSLSENWILSIQEDSKGRIWVGTNGGGLNLWEDPLDSFICFSTDNGLPGNVINAILEGDDKNLWISTNNGLARFNYDSLRITAFNKNDGLQINRYTKNAAFQDQKGNLYFGGINGLNYFIPDDIKDNTFIPPVVITNIKISHRPLNIHHPKSPVHKNYHLVKEVNLRNKHLVFSIEFASLNYTQPEENRYKYMLEGFEEDWNDPGQSNSVTYTNLPAGKYTFKVIGSNNDDIWNNEATSLQVIVHPPFYEAWWFITIIILVFLYLLFLIYQSRVTNVRIMNAKLSELVAERTKELEERNYEIAQQNKEISEQRDLATSQRDQIQEQKEELEQHRNRLQQLIDERTNELMLAKEKAEESDKLKTAFLENLSHEIRTPMNAILGFMNLLSEKIDDKESRNYYMRIINESGKNMLRLIEDIIDFSRMQTGDLKPEFADCNTTEVIKDLTLRMREKASREKQRINILSKLPDVTVNMFTDEKKLRQIFSKLLENSLQNTNSGHISLGIDQQSEQHITFFVEDTGTGIDKEHLDKIFDRFFTVNEENVPKGVRGSGLGLAFAKTITEIMGGEIWVESKKSKGSIFYFSLPFLKVNSQKRAGSDTITEHKYYWPEKTVLVAEDEESNFLLIEAMLRDTKVKMVHVKDGIELLEKVDEDSKFDLVLLDLKMPRMGGLNAMKIIREHHENMPVIVQTAYDQTQHRQKSIELGCDDFLIKPLKKKELLEVVKKYLG